MDIKSLHKEGHSIKAIARQTGRSRNTVRRVLRQPGPTSFKQPQRHSRLDAFKTYLRERWEAGGFRYDLLELTIRKILPHAQNRRVVASLAIKSAEPLTSEGADEIAIYLSAQAKLRSLQVVIRSDPWFADDEAYPYVNPFIETGNPPDWESYGHTLAYYCTPTENQSACTRSIPMIDKGNN